MRLAQEAIFNIHFNYNCRNATNNLFAYHVVYVIIIDMNENGGTKEYVIIGDIKVGKDL